VLPSKMKSLKHYFASSAADSVTPAIGNSKPAINLVIGKRKHPVGRPRKVAATNISC